MGTRNGKTEAIAAFVRAKPGCTRAQILARFAMDVRNALPTYCTKAGMIHAAGPRGSQRYYPTAAQAAQAHARVVVDALARRALQRRRQDIRQNLRRRAARHAAGGRVRNAAPGGARLFVHLDPGVTIAPDVRITIAPRRWA